ncbi:methyltransferase family protein [Candidatus Binatus soli]|jgi:protein-S-isoprenylcysteine O-methyltransferase Ste14|uniref:methyltransferase family protein n=1 Tax=Candidatus Binatus soli TaxID=1953413 RepID=UPI003D135457
MRIFGDPFFWALVSMFGLASATAGVGSTRLGKFRSLGLVTVGMFTLGRVVLVLPAVTQPRLVAGDWIWVVGGVIFAAGMVFALPAFAIRPFTGPEAGVSLRTGGFYRIVRNPLYLSDVLWCLGWAVMFRSEIGIALVPVWWAGLWLLTIIEEESLERKLGQPYIEYRRRIRGRILPGLPL